MIHKSLLKWFPWLANIRGCFSLLSVQCRSLIRKSISIKIQRSINNLLLPQHSLRSGLLIKFPRVSCFTDIIMLYAIIHLLTHSRFYSRTELIWSTLQIHEWNLVNWYFISDSIERDCIIFNPDWIHHFQLGNIFTWIIKRKILSSRF